MPIRARLFALALIALQPAAAGWEEGQDAFDKEDFALAYREWKPLADDGDARAQFMLGILFEEGRGVEADPRQAWNWYGKAADQQFFPAYYRLGTFFETGKGGVPRDMSNAIQFYRRAAEHGVADAQYRMGLVYTHHVKPPDHGKARDYFVQAAEQDHVRAMLALAGLYAGGGGSVPADAREAARWNARAADMGNATGEFNLAMQYLQGRGVDEMPKMAARLLDRSARQGHPAAQYMLGRLYEDGTGVEQDLAEAAHWYRQAANRQEDSARARLAALFEHGRGVEQDLAMAFSLYEAAANGSERHLSVKVATMLSEGKGVAQDHAAAAAWYRRAAEAGHPDGMVYLGVVHLFGLGIQRDVAKAIELAGQAMAKRNVEGYFLAGLARMLDATDMAGQEAGLRLLETAAMAGFPPAQAFTGRAYAEGKGAPPDLARALFWLELAARAETYRLHVTWQTDWEQIHQESRELRERIVAELPRSQVSEVLLETSRWSRRDLETPP